MGKGLIITIVSLSLLFAGEAIYVVASGKLFKSTDYGEKWTRIGEEIPGFTCINGVLIEDVPRRYVLYAGTALNGMYKSTDLGHSWIPINNGLPLPLPKFVEKIVISPLNPDEIFIIFSVGSGTKRAKAIYHSLDAGKNWSCFPAPPGYSTGGTAEFDIATDGALWLCCDKPGPLAQRAILRYTEGTGWVEKAIFVGPAVLPRDLVCSPFDHKTVFFQST